MVSGEYCVEIADRSIFILDGGNLVSPVPLT
jgi:hypothetical protein